MSGFLQVQPLLICVASLKLSWVFMLPAPSMPVPRYWPKLLIYQPYLYKKRCRYEHENCAAIATGPPQSRGEAYLPLHGDARSGLILLGS